MRDAYTELETILHQYKMSLPEPDPGWPHEVQRAVNYIHEHLFEPDLTVGDMKARCYINGNGFSGKFRYYMGHPPKAYWLNCRIRLAKQLLEEKEDHLYNIVDLALYLGFHSHAAFSKIFRERSGYKPSQWGKITNGQQRKK